MDVMSSTERGGDGASQMALLTEGPGAVPAQFPRKGLSAETRIRVSEAAVFPRHLTGSVSFTATI